MARLDGFVALLERWQNAVNLVGGDTLDDLWRRHILDSAQLMPLLPENRPVITDLGSGAGFPGLVLAIMTGAEVHLVESAGKKAQFMKEAARQDGGVDVTVHQERIERLDPWKTDLITARALAPLDLLLEYAERFGAGVGRENPACLFLKGRRAGEELTQASARWNMDYSLTPSLSDAEGTIVAVRSFSRG